MSRNEIGRKKMNHARNRWDVACAVILAGGMVPAGSVREAYGQTCPAITDPAPLNTNAATDSGDDNHPQVVTDGLGNWVAVWNSEDDLGGMIGDDWDILFSRSTDNGATWADPAALNTNAATDSGVDRWPQLTTDGAGNWVAVWVSSEDLGGTIGTDLDVLFSRSTDNGVSWTVPAALNSNAASDSGHDYTPQLTTDGMGNWVAVWRSFENLGGTIGTDSDILFSRSMDNGVSWTVPTALNSNAASDIGNDYFPQLTTDGAGNWVAVWRSSNDRTGWADTDILFSRSTDNGATWTDPAPLNTNAATDSGDDMEPQLTTDGLGNWVAVWQSTDDLGGTIGFDLDILFSRSTDDGATWSDPAALKSNAASDSSHDYTPQVTTDGMGNWVAVWRSTESLCGTIGFDYDILFSLSKDNGTTWSDPAALNTNAADDSGFDWSPQLTTDGMGNWFAVWASLDDLGGTIGTDADILGAQFEIAGSFTLAAAHAQSLIHDDADATGGSISLVPISASDPYTIVDNEIIIQKGTQWVILEVRLANWGTEGCLTQLGAYAARVNEWEVRDALVRAAVPCASDEECTTLLGNGTQCGGCCKWSPIACVPGFIDESRSDYVFFGLDSWPFVDAHPNMRFNPYVFSPPFAADPGYPLYGGTIVLNVLPDVTGTFKVDLLPYPNSGMWDPSGGPFAVTLSPALIHIDCNGNGIPDEQDIAVGTSNDCNENDIPDECETGGVEDCNANGTVDLCDIEAGTSEDCDVLPHNCCDSDHGPGCSDPDIEACVCELYSYCCDTLGWWDSYCVGLVEDYGCGLCPRGNGIPDECEPDCNDNLQPDSCDIGGGISEDCNFNGIPDECEDTSADCNDNAIWDACDIHDGTSQDCNGNWIPDDCLLLEDDCNENLVPDSCDVDFKISDDCNENGVPDECDLASGTSRDCNENGILEECEFPPPTAAEDVIWVGPESCSSDSECPNESVCRDGICYFTYNRFLRFHPPNATRPAAIRIRHVASGATKFVALPFNWLDIGSSRLLKVSRTSDVPSYWIWPTQAINVTDCFIVPGQVYEIQAIGSLCDPDDEGAYSAPLLLPTATFADAVGIHMRLPPEGVVNIISDALGSLEAFQGYGETTSLLHYDMEPEIPDLSINITDVMEFVRGFRSREEYRFSAPQNCP